MNVIGRVSLTFDIPESVIERLMDETDDGTEYYSSRAYDAVAEALADGWFEYSDYIINEDVEVD